MKLLDGNEPMKIMGFQTKLLKHLRNENDVRVRDYIIHLRMSFPDLNKCPIDKKIVKEACDFLREKGWELHLNEQHENKPSQFIRRKDFQTKILLEHLRNKDDIRVRDYIIFLRVNFPDFNECPIDKKIVKEACDFLREKGWELHLGENHEQNPYQYISKKSF